MTVSRARRGRLLAAAAVLVLLALSACSSKDDSPTVSTNASTPSTTAAGPATTGPATGNVVGVTFRGGKVVEGAARQRVPVNQPVIVRVTSDVADEVHVHGYDKHADVAAGSTTDLRFDANVPGVFEVELEKAHKTLFTLEVR
jgi:heme/copper-type cytochrome/quinol oxidase subunit 2